ncbi:MAG TPA: hypothetical protein VE684_12360 [Crenalkalicoccus sp.]|jgi:hypothetical protein|nr:hypothetical protein [Crenalkalicoccus sp.]
MGPITVIGHPFTPIGMGEQMRSHIAALRAAGAEVRVYDLFRHAPRTDPAHLALVGEAETDRLGPLRIFHINGDEVAPALAVLAQRGETLAGGRNIIVPAWELPRYPEPWARELRRFDAVWALSRFIAGSLAAADIAAPVIGQSVQPLPGPLLPRRYFGLREDAVLLLLAFDLTSYATRKNPEGAVALFRRVAALDAARRPGRPLQLVLKVKDGAQPAEGWAERLGLTDGQASVISRPLSALETRSLIAACDVFLSLHRAEGFGRGTAEAMWHGRLALGTGWSGTLDHMEAETSLLVQAREVPVPEGAYPHAEGQHWAEPDLDHATALLDRALREPGWAAALAARGRAAVRLRFSDRAIGLRLLAALQG